MANGGGINVSSGATVVLHKLNIHDCGALFQGRGIYNQGNLTITKSLITNNFVGASGGGVATSGPTTMIDTTISHNIGNCSEVQGIAASNFPVRLIRSAVVDNVGGIYCGYQAGPRGISVAGGTVFIDDSIVPRNAVSAGTTEIYLWGTTARISNSTITGFFPSPLRTDNGKFILQNTIISNQTPAGCMIPAFTSYGYNLIGNDPGCGKSLRLRVIRWVSRRAFCPLVARLHCSPAVRRLMRVIPSIAPMPQGITPCWISVDLSAIMMATSDGVARCDIGSYEYDPLNPVRLTFLPRLNYATGPASPAGLA